ncbi:sodium/proline symporter [Salibacter halophilus]|uniref:Sodium/proline symporter n=1 Tax=Salibacter halophilus TaxID=1803916 RepID=A0A6N6M6H9_9FLAO|nr:sodium/proline symporter [Salibacter halophilus]KAB1065217.1 sodium/proline symporter [Salibacter halophilus]
MITKLVVLGIYVGILFLIGFVASKRIKGLDDFYVGGKKIGYWAVAFSARATGESGWLLLGVTGMGAIAGFSAYWVVIGELLGVAISWFFMAKPFKRLTDKYNSITIPDYFESHFKTKTHMLRVISSSALAIFVIIYVSAQIDITGKAFEDFLGFDYFTGAIIGFLIVLTYIFVGGFVAVVWSDLFQGIMMFLGLMALPIVAYFTIDHSENIIGGLNNIDPALTSMWGTSDDMWMNISTMIGFAMIGLGFLGSPQVYVRFISVRNIKEINQGRWVAVVFTLLTDAAAVTIGILGRYLFTEAGQDPEAILGNSGEDVLTMMVSDAFPLVITAIYVAIILSAIMSTIDSLLVVASSAITRDFYQQIFRPDLDQKDLGTMSRLVTLGMALLALGVAISVALISPTRTVFWFSIFGWSGIAATFCPVMILSLFWKAYTERGAIASMITGFASVPFFKFYVQNLDGIGKYFEAIDVMAPSFVTAFIAGFIVTKLFPSKPIETEIIPDHPKEGVG